MSICGTAGHDDRKGKKFSDSAVVVANLRESVINSLGILGKKRLGIMAAGFGEVGRRGRREEMNPEAEMRKC